MTSCTVTLDKVRLRTQSRRRWVLFGITADGVPWVIFRTDNQGRAATRYIAERARRHRVVVVDTVRHEITFDSNNA